jgi:excisionase family DNA binding protein
MKPEKPITGQSLLTVLEAANYAKVTRVVIDLAIREGELRIVKLGPATRRIRLSELEKWLDSKSIKEIKQ